MRLGTCICDLSSDRFQERGPDRPRLRQFKIVAQGRGDICKRRSRSEIARIALVQDEERNLFAGMIGPAKCRIVSVVGRDDNEIVQRNLRNEVT